MTNARSPRAIRSRICRSSARCRAALISVAAACGALLLFRITPAPSLPLAASPTAPGTIYYSQDFEGPQPPTFTTWYSPHGQKYTSRLSTEQAVSGRHSAYIEMGYGYVEIPLPHALKWDRGDPQGIGNQPLYLSARIYPEALGEADDTRLGFRAGIVPKHHAVSEGVPLSSPDARVHGPVGQWQLVVLDVGKALREQEERGQINPDQIVLHSISLISYGGGKFYIDDIRLATTPPDGWQPAPPAKPVVDAARYFRPNPALDAIVWHSVWGGDGSPLTRDILLHPAVARDLKRLYIDINGPGSPDFRVTAPPRQLRELDLLLSQSRQWDMPLIPASYIGTRYSSAARTWSDAQLKARLTQVVERLRDQPGLFAWYLEDEPPASRLAQYLKEKQWVEEADPSRSVLSIFNQRDSCDLIGPAETVVLRDIYPIQGPGNPWQVPHEARHEARLFEQPFVVTDQVFSGDSWREPTLGEWRLMVYGALAEGARGFCHFAYSLPPPFQQHDERPMVGTLVDAYGVPGPIHQELERHFGPDLMSIGELTRTCRPADPPTGAQMQCGTVETTLEQKLPAIALTRLVDQNNRYEIIGLYNNDPNAAQSGTLRLPSAYTGGRRLLDLSAHSNDIVRREPFWLPNNDIPIRLEPGDGRFLALVRPEDAPELLRRMQTSRFGSLRKMVDFDIKWMDGIGRGDPQWAARDAALQQLCDSGQPAQALGQLQALDAALATARAHDAALSEVLAQLDSARHSLSAACRQISLWALYRNGAPTPADSEPGKGYVEAQRRLGVLLTGYGDLAYTHEPTALVQPTRDFARLCQQQEAQLQLAGAAVPAQPSSLAEVSLQSLEATLARLGWQRTPDDAELSNG